MARRSPPPRLRAPARALDQAAAEHFMALAIAQAEQGEGHSSPNPSVGAVVVRAGKVVGQGHTAPVGGPHAEIVALRQAGAKARGADLYSTLEPCNHTGRTGPCTEAILKAGVRRVFYGSRDPNPHVPGAGGAWLRQRGVEVVPDLLRARCDALHAPFFKHVTTGLPFVTLKVASTLDGRLAASSGDSRWITGEAARERVHKLRARVDAVLVGAGTARADDPRLTARAPGVTRQPLRVVLDGRAPLPASLQLFRDGAAPTLLVTAHPEDKRLRTLARRGVEVLRLPARGHELDLGALFRELGRRGVVHLLCEGGATLASALVRERRVDRLELYLAPRLLGAGKGWLELPATRSMAEALELGRVSYELVGQDLLVTASVPQAASRRRAAGL